MKRKFSKDEAQRIFADAAERQQATAQDSDDYLTLEELQESAAAAGIDPAHVRASAEFLVRPARAAEQRRFLGIPVDNRQVVTLPFTVDDHSWNRVVVELRSIFRKRGIASDVGAIREWISDGSDQQSPVRVTAEPAGDATRITIERSTLRQALGLGAGTASLALTALILFTIALAGGDNELWIPALIMTAISVLLSAGLFAGTHSIARRDANRFDEAVRRIRQIGEEQTAVGQKTTARERIEPSHEKPPVGIDDEPTIAPAEEPTQRRRRER